MGCCCRSVNGDFLLIQTTTIYSDITTNYSDGMLHISLSKKELNNNVYSVHFTTFLYHHFHSEVMQDHLEMTNKYLAKIF